MNTSQDHSDETRNAPSPEVRCTILATVKKFRRTDIHCPGGERPEELFEYRLINGDYLDLGYTIAVYANGRDHSTKGSVCVLFVKPPTKGNIEFVQIDLSGVVSIIDVWGDRWRPRSFEISRDLSIPQHDPNLAIDDYILRSVLLEMDESSSGELLPEDTLTLHVDIFLKRSRSSHVFVEFDVLRMLYEGFFRSEEEDRICLLLDTPFGIRLAQESQYFERLSITPMAEKEARLVIIPNEEHPMLLKIGRILFDGKSFTFESVDEIFDLYVTADKYGIKVAVDICRCWLKLCLDDDNASEISEFADMVCDDRLKEIIGTFLRGSNEVETDDVQQLHATTSRTEESWYFKRRDLGSYSYLVFGKLNLEEERNKKERGGYNFYF